MSKFYLCSFADSNMCISAFRFKNQAKNLKYTTGRNVFDDVFIYNDDSLPLWFKKIFNGKMYGFDLDVDEKYKNWGGVKGQVRGFGYWCWKPCVILETLKQIEDGDFLLYLDIGFEFCNGYDDVISNILNNVDKNEIMAIQLNDDYHQESKWNKMDFLIHFNLQGNEEFLKSCQISGGFICMKKTRKTLNIINQWMDFYINYFDLVTDKPSVSKNLSCFIEHRHDQSVLGAIMKIRKCSFFSNSYLSCNHKNGFPFLCNRDKQFLFSDSSNIVFAQNNGYIDFNFPRCDSVLYINNHICDSFYAEAIQKFIQFYNKKGNFFRRVLRLYFKYPKWLIKYYKIYKKL